MLAKSLTSRDFLRIRCSELLNDKLTLSKEARWEQALSAKTVRNFWFTASAAPPDTGTTETVVIAQTQRFSEPVIVTDLLSMFDFKAGAGVSAMVSRYKLKITKYGIQDGNGIGLFGSSSPVGAEFITKHEKNYSTAVTIATFAVQDTQPKYLPLVPFILRPYEFIVAEWTDVKPSTRFDTQLATDGWALQLGFRAVRVLPIDNPYRYISAGPERRIKDYINASEPETYLLDVSFPLASIPALALAPGVPFVVKTPQQGRPLLVLGAVSNLEGAQGGLSAEGERYNFTALDPQKTPIVGGAILPVDVPLNLWAPNSDFRNVGFYNMFPVPHLLEPGEQLRMSLTSGQVRQGGIPFFQIVADTRNNADVKITFICRTV